MHNDPVSVLTALYTAWKVQDVAGVMELCTPDICYVVHEPPDITGTGGCMVGTDEVRRFLTAMARDWDFLEVVPGEFHIDGNDIREHMWYRAEYRETGEILEGTKRHIWTFRDGWLCLCQEFQDSQTMHAFLAMSRTRASSTPGVAEPAAAGRCMPHQDKPTPKR